MTNHLIMSLVKFEAARNTRVVFARGTRPRFAKK